ncbi:peptidyl-tRNA hydrolase [Batrachochytrium salamandrivorans]|nr:peptidyl-tRNA hydrolase [Batrachochytrium salamandrivorans]
MSSAIWILWASLVETTEPQQLFLYGAVCGVVLTALVMLPLMLLTKLTEPQRVLARAAAGRHQPIATEVLLVRTDLEMTKGKAAAQCCHAALAVYQSAQEKSTKTREWIKAWKKYGQAKITLKCPDEATMLAIQAEARILGLPAKSICDAGKTQIKAGSRTVLAIGPAPADLIDKVSGKCRLY